MRKLCIDEVGGSKKNLNEKKRILQFKKMYFLYYYFLATSLALHFKNDL
jgi:hypothetical protein